MSDGPSSSRRGFLSRLFLGGAAAAASTVVPNAGAPTPEPVQPSLRPKCLGCGMLMQVRSDIDFPKGLRRETTIAYCANTKCTYYFTKYGLQHVEDRA